MNSYGSLDDLLSDLSIEPPDRSDGRSGPAPGDEEPLTLSTIHSAKGLEWQVVFLLGVRDGVLPSSKALQDEEDVEEELRLLYVAVTRVKSYLFLTMSHHASHGGLDQFHRLSRFIEPANVMLLLDRRSRDEVYAGRGKGIRERPIRSFDSVGEGRPPQTAAATAKVRTRTTVPFRYATKLG